MKTNQKLLTTPSPSLERRGVLSPFFKGDTKNGFYLSPSFERDTKNGFYLSPSFEGDTKNGFYLSPSFKGGVRGGFYSSPSFKGGVRDGFYFLLLSFVFCVSITKTTAQTSLNTAGGEAIGAGGTLTFSVGQLVYTYNADATRIVAQGVQQPFQPLIPLSVSLLNFTAKCSSNAVIFNWCTISEENNAYFTLESSKDAINFTKIAKIKGNNTTNNTNCYEFTLDNTVINANNSNVTTNNPVINANNSNVTANYYRLSSTDTKETTEYFKVITKNCNVTIDFSFNVFPNPNNGTFTINANAEMSYNIINSLGQSVDNGQIISKNINLSHLSKGIYYVIGQNNSKIITKKIVIE